MVEFNLIKVFSTFSISHLKITSYLYFHRNFTHNSLSYGMGVHVFNASFSVFVRHVVLYNSPLKFMLTILLDASDDPQGL